MQTQKKIDGGISIPGAPECFSGESGRTDSHFLPAFKELLRGSGSLLHSLFSRLRPKPTLVHRYIGSRANAARYPAVRARSMLVRRCMQDEDIVPWLHALQRHDAATYRHSVYVAELVAAFSRFLRLEWVHRTYLVRAALVHDVGKLMIAPDTLNKATPLDRREVEEMRSHAEAGYLMLRHRTSLREEILEVVRQHHERLDGSGYPHGLRAMDLPPSVRLMMLCDIYAAMTEARTYRSASTPTEALVEMEKMRMQLDVKMLKQFHLFILGRGRRLATARAQVIPMPEPANTAGAAFA